MFPAAHRDSVAEVPIEMLMMAAIRLIRACINPMWYIIEMKALKNMMTGKI